MIIANNSRGRRGGWIPDGDAIMASERLFWLSNELMCSAGFDGFFKRVNPAFTKTLGYTSEELLATPFIEFVHPEDRSATIEEVQLLAAGEKTTRFENRYLDKQGQYRTLCWNAVPLVEEGRILAVARDVTTERETLRQLSRANEILAAVGRAQSLIIENTGSRVLFDDLLQVLLNLTHSEFGFIGEVIHDPHGDRFLRAHASSNVPWDIESLDEESNTSTGLNFRYLNTLTDSVLTTGHAVISNRPHDDPDHGGISACPPKLNSYLGLPFFRSSKMIGMVGLANCPGGYQDDVVQSLEPVIQASASVIQAFRIERERTEQEERLRISEERFDLAVNGSSDGIWDWNVVANDVYYAPRFKQLLGYSDDEMNDTFAEWESRLHPDDREMTLESVQLHLNFGTPYDVEYRLITKIGEYRWFRARGQAVWDDSGKPTRMAGSITDVTDRKSAENRLARVNAQLEVLASTDALTGIANRSTFDSRLNQAWHRHLEDDTCLSLLLVDIDCFKEYNDTLGHLAGDACLRVVAELISGSLRESAADIAARYGGEEFGIILPGTDAAGASAVARRIIQRVRDERLSHPRSKVDSVVTVSVGGATTGTDQIGSQRDLVQSADTALYRAKESGRNRYVNSTSQAVSHV